MIGKNRIETICRNAGMVPVARDKIDGAEVFIADGFSTPPHVKQRRWLEKNEFPWGCFVTLWWVSKGDEKLDTGQPIFFDAFHDSNMSLASKKIARINMAKQTALDFLRSRKRARLNG